MSHQQSGLISEDFIRSLLEKNDIVQLIHQSVPLKKAGANYTACCPFHNEKSPSFMVTPSKQFYHCFGCGVSGDAISFLRAFYNLSFVEAVERLATHLGIALPQTQYKPQYNESVYKPYLLILEKVALFYQQQLKQHSDNKAPIEYLKSRGLDGYTAKTFRVGYAPSQWDSLVRYFQNEQDSLLLLETLGLIIRHEKGHYFDRFRHRIIFPIRNRKGEVIGFGGRSVSPTDNPKYTNSPESLVFKKGNHLYGIYEAQQNHSKWQVAICVEGYLDVIGLYQQGIVGAFATMGTALTPVHIKRLFQLSSNLVFCFDGDQAGRNAAWKALETLLPNYLEEKRVRFLFLPEGEDPDSYVRTQGKGVFLEQLNKSLSLSEYFFSTLCERYPPENVENRAQLIRVGRQYIEQLPKSTYKQMMLEALAQLTSTSQNVVMQKYNFLSKKQSKPRWSNHQIAAPPPLLGPAYIASGLLITEPSLIALIDRTPAWDHINMPGLNLLKSLCDLLLTAPMIEAAAIMEALLTRGFTRNLLQQCYVKVKFIPKEGRKEELLGSLERILVIGRNQVIENLLKKSEIQTLSDEEKEMLKKFLTFRESSENKEL